MSENEDDIFIPTIIINILIILITIYVLILYIKSKELRSYSCAHILNLCIIFFLDNVIRIIPVSDDNSYKVIQYIQAWLLTSFDKTILLLLTVQVFTIYIAKMKTDFYLNNKRVIFFTNLFGSLGLSLLIGGLYALNGLDKYGIYFYVKGSDTKKICDTAFNSIFLFFNTFFCGVIILNLAIKKGEMQQGIIDKDTNYKHDLFRMILMFLANSFLFIESYLIIYDILEPYNFIDLYYLISCLIVSLIYAINKIIIRETKKLFCSSKNKGKERTNTYNYVSKTSSKKTVSNRENSIDEEDD